MAKNGDLLPGRHPPEADEPRLVRAEGVGLVGRQDLGPGGDLRREGLELLHDDPIVLEGIASRVRRNVDDMDEKLGPFDVAEKADAQTLAEVGALDEPGDVGDDERAVLPEVDDAEVGR
jgi:hypothetical protein